MKKSITKKIFLGIFIAIAAILFAFVAIFIRSNATDIFLSLLTIFEPNPPKPEITYQEFPFNLVYEIDGEIFEINDAYVCEFDGFRYSAGSGDKSRVWKVSLKSGNERTTLLKTEEFEIFYSKINAYIYMDEPDYIVKSLGITLENSHPRLRFANDFEKRRMSVMDDQAKGIWHIEYPKSLTDEEAWEEYKLRIISWECPPPIENKFE